jgi:hypothetical protein
VTLLTFDERQPPDLAFNALNDLLQAGDSCSLGPKPFLLRDG